jgi:hypothetical protein
MEITESFSVSVESKPSPTTWYELINMTIKRAVYHYYKWHSNLLTYKDFTCNFTDQNIQYFDADRTSLYDACNTLLDGTIKGRMLSDSLGHIWAEQDVSAIDGAPAALVTSLEVTKDDWIDTPTIDERHYEEVSFIEMGGIAYEPGTNASAAYLASAPGSAPAYRGKVERKQGLALSSQSQLNTLVGNLYAYSNSKYPNIELKLRSNYANLDIAPQEQIKLTIETNDTPRRITFTDKSFAIRSVSWNWDATSQILIPTISVAEITQGFVGTTIIIPVIPPDAGDDGGSFKQPPIITPPIPTPTPISGTGTSQVVHALQLATNEDSGIVSMTGSLSQWSAIKWADGSFLDLATDESVSSVRNPVSWYDEGTDETKVVFPATGYYLCTFVVHASVPTIDGIDQSIMITKFNSSGVSNGTSIVAETAYLDGHADDDALQEITNSTTVVFYASLGEYIKCLIDSDWGSFPTRYTSSISIIGFPV